MIIDLIYDQIDSTDIIKIIFSLAAGIILGSERELKDKSAGFKTIATICLGSTLFTILSYKMGASPSEDATRIASYVVSGIGFLGAGVIFKDKYNVHGLTTASIIWMAAAIGMAFGFGEFALGIMFLLGCLFIISAGKFLNKIIFGKKQHKQLNITIDLAHSEYPDLVKEIKQYCIVTEVKHLHKEHNQLKLNLDIVIRDTQYFPLTNYLNKNNKILDYTF